MRLFRKAAPAPEYAICERVTATDTSPRHIRKLTAAGMFPGGGADGLALCGAAVAWDTSAVSPAEVPNIVAHETETYRLCRACVTEVMNLAG